MVASSYQHTIDIDTWRTWMMAETEKLFWYNDLETIDLTKIINDIQEQYGIRERIRILKEYLDCEPENQNYITWLSIEYINLNDYNSAIIEFNKLRRLWNPLWEIGIKILNEQDYRIAKLLNWSEIKYYLQFKKADYTLSKVEIIIKWKDVTIDLDKNFRYELSEKIEWVKITNTEKTEIELASLLIAPFINWILETKYSVEILKYL